MTADTLDHDVHLNKTQKIRHQLIDALVEQGLPDDYKTRLLLLSALDSSDKSVLSKAKIKSQERASDNQHEVAETISRLLLQLSQKSNKVGQAPAPVDFELSHPIPGEMDQGEQHLTYDEFKE